MSFNLLEVLQSQVTGGLAKQAAGFLGESEGGITKALGAAFPAILGSVLDKGSSESGAGELMDLMKGQDTGFMDNISGLFGGGGAMGSLLGSGGGMLQMLMGDKVGGVVSLISKVAGIGDGATGKLLKMAAPLLMGTLGKQVMKNGLNIGGLMDMLGGQKDHLAKANMPSGLGDMLGFGSLLSGVGNLVGGGVDAGTKVVGGAVNAGSKVVGGAVDLGGKAVGAAASVGSAAVDTAAKTGSSLLKWLIPAIIVLGFLSYFFGFKTGCNAVDNVTDSAVNVTEGVVSGAGDLAKDAANATADGVKAVGNAAVDGAKTVGNATVDGVKTVGDVAGSAAGTVVGAFGSLFSKIDEAGKKALDAMTFTAGSAADQFNKFITGGAKGTGVFQFKNLNFATGSAAIDAASKKEVDNIAAILKAYPNVKVQVAGHTDKTGDASKNMSLSSARAEAVKGILIAQGIDVARLSAHGYGSAQPVSETATNAENRRIEVRIIK